MEGQQLGKIQSVRFGLEEGRLGIFFCLGGEGWGVNDSRCSWCVSNVPGKNHKWDESDRSKSFDDLMRYINQLLLDAKVDEVSRLQGVPVRVFFEGNALRRWEVLKEVL